MGMSKVALSSIFAKGSRSTVKTAVVHDGVAFGYAHCDAAKRNEQDRSPGA